MGLAQERRDAHGDAQGKKKKERKEDKGDLRSRAGNYLFFYFVSEKENAERRKAFMFWSLDVHIC